MEGKDLVDIPAAHRFFAANCFNRAWDFIDKKERTREEEEEMLHLCLSSLWHWTQRPDCDEQARSIGFWQVSRVFALLGHADLATRYAQRCLEASQAGGVGPFFLGYAFEALTRAAFLAGNLNETEEYRKQALEAAKAVPDKADREQLENDVRSIFA